MAKTILKKKEECEDLLRGCTFMGVGGGGMLEPGLRYLTKDIESGKEIVLIDPDDVPDDAWTCAAYYVGTIAPPTPEVLEKKKKLKSELLERELEVAVRELEEYMNIGLYAIFSFELGGFNTAASIDAAVKCGIPVIDGDCCGRAVPEIEETTHYLSGKSIVPIVGCDEFGNVSIIKRIASYAYAENMLRWLSVASLGRIGTANAPMKGKDLKEVVILKTLTKSMALGKAIREAREKGGDPVKAIINYTKGWLLFKGRVTKKTWEDKGGFMYGENELEGIEGFAGHKFKFWFKNENHVSWVDEKPFVSSPDLIGVVDNKTGEPKTNTEIKIGDEVAVIGLKVAKQFRTEEGINVLSPKHFGFDIKYVPIEEQVKGL